MINKILFSLISLGLLSNVVFAETIEEVSWIEQEASNKEDQVIAWRRDIHENPELGRFETRTSKKVADHLRNLNIEVIENVAKTGVIGILQGDMPGPTIALRADMDALPIKEETNLPFASNKTGIYFDKEVPVMHACGHDGHTAMLMGAAEILSENKDKISGTVVFIFQPAEEGAADIDDFDKNAESAGAVKIIEEGILEKYDIEAIFGIHVMPEYPAGQYVYKENAILNSADSFRIKVIGKGTHGSMPWLGNDPIVASAQIINGAQTIISRRINSMDGSGILSFGSISGGNASNIIPNEVLLGGTIRSNNPDIRDVILREFPVQIKNIANAYNTDVEVEVANLSAVTVNNPALTRQIISFLKKINHDIYELDVSAAASEDFSAYAEKIPGLFMFLGVNNGDDVESLLHSSTFVMNEKALKYGVMAHIGFVMGYKSKFDAQKKAID